MERCCRPDKRVTRRPAIGAAPLSRWKAFVGRVRRSRHPAMGLAFGILWNGSVHQALGSFINLLCGERDKGSGRAPLVNPRGPARKSVLRTALTSRVPDCGRLDSTCSPVPGLAPCLGSPLSAIHGVQTLSFTLRFADFSGGQHRRCETAGKSKTVSLELRFGRPDKATPPSGNQCRGDNAGWRVPLIRPTRFQRLRYRRPDKAKPPSGNRAAVIMPDGAHAYPAYAVPVRSLQRHHKKTAIRRNARWRF